MSGEHSETALSLTPVHGPWNEVRLALFGSFQDHNRIATFPTRARFVTVNPINRVIEEQRAPFDLESSGMAADAEDREGWLCIAAKLRIGRGWFSVRTFLRSIGKDRTAIEIQFPSQVYESIYKFDPDDKEVDEAVKFDLIQFCVDTSGAVGAEGFGYDFTHYHKVLGPPRLHSLEKWVDNNPNRAEQLPDQWILAGVSAACVSIEQLRARDGFQSHVYERGGYILYDVLWPSVLDE